MVFIVYLFGFVFLYWVGRKAYKKAKEAKGQNKLLLIDRVLDTFFLKYIPKFFEGAFKYIFQLLKCLFAAFLNTTRFLSKIMLFPFYLLFILLVFTLYFLKNLIDLTPSKERQEKADRKRMEKEERKRQRKASIEEFIEYFPNPLRWVPRLFIAALLLASFPFRLIMNGFTGVFIGFYTRVILALEAAYDATYFKMTRRRREREYLRQQVYSQTEEKRSEERRKQLEYQAMIDTRHHEMEMIRAVNQQEDYF